jgi:hypothetical protein
MPLGDAVTSQSNGTLKLHPSKYSLQENLILLTEFFEGLKPSINY